MSTSTHRTCLCGCGTSLENLRVDALYASDACRKRAKRAQSADKVHLRAAAQRAVYEAIKRGDLTRPDECERCGRPADPKLRKPNIEGHHADYRKPLEVEWLCKQCHGEEHTQQQRARRQQRDGKGVRIYVLPDDDREQILRKAQDARARSAS